MLKSITLHYTLGDRPYAWFHTFVADFKTCGIEKSKDVCIRLYINGPETPAFISASTRHPVLNSTPSPRLGLTQ